MIRQKIIMNKKSEQAIQIKTNEMDTSACSVIQGCWVGSSSVGTVLIEDTHGDKACSYGDTKTRQQPATKQWLTTSVFRHAPPQAEASEFYAW